MIFITYANFVRSVLNVILSMVRKGGLIILNTVPFKKNDKQYYYNTYLQILKK